MPVKARVIVIHRLCADREFPQARQIFDLCWESEYSLKDEELIAYYRQEYPKATEIKIERLSTC